MVRIASVEPKGPHGQAGDRVCATWLTVLPQSEGVSFTARRGVYGARYLYGRGGLKELEQLHLLTTPVTKIDGEVVVGFDREKLERLLA